MAFVPSVFASLSKQQKRFAALLSSLLGVLCVFFVFNLLFPLNVRVVYARQVLSAEEQTLGAFLSTDQKWRLYAPLSDLSEELVAAVLVKEDRYFYWHPGFNPIAMARAAWNNFRNKRHTSGASTITMQTVRLLEPRPRTYLSKLVEVFRAMQLEWQYSKKEILELYLNLVPYGGNIEGVRAAALLYFGSEPNQLSASEATLLAIIPNRPTTLALSRAGEVLTNSRNVWLRRLQQEGVFSAEQVADALAEPVEIRRRPIPRAAPHLASRLHQQGGTEHVLHTTIRAATQKAVSQVLGQYMARLQAYNITNGAVLVVDNSTREVIAYAGSKDFSDDASSGQVDGTRAIRSPGSTLKPLIYGLAFDRGLYTPKMTLTDVPTDFGNYHPENFDRTFNGRVTVATALAYSLNVPAVKVLDELGLPVLLDALKQARFRRIIRDEKKLGLSTALGGCGATLEELAGLYCAFANGGLYAPLRYLTTPPPSPPDTVRLLSPQATWMLTDILTTPERPDLPNNAAHSLNAPRVAWKTGTSYGRRDAWSVGYSTRYTVAVWVGNFNGEGVPELTGAQIATPLFFRVFQAVERNPEEWPGPPEGLLFRLVCNQTGLLPELFCEHQITDYFIPLISPARRCTHQRLAFLSPNADATYCSACLPPSGYRQEWVDNPPPELLAWYEARKTPYQRLPPHNPTCDRVLTSQPPAITSPSAGKEYLSLDQPIQLLLACQVPADVQAVYWYINDQFLQKAAPSERIFFSPPAGSVKISCSDDRGRHSDIRIFVR